MSEEPPRQRHELRIDQCWRDTDPLFPTRRVQILEISEDGEWVSVVDLYRSGAQVPNTKLVELASRYRYGDCYRPDDTGFAPPADVTEELEALEGDPDAYQA